MKQKNIFIEVRQLDDEVAKIAPLVHDAFACYGGPSEQVEALIRQESKRIAARHRILGFQPERAKLALVACMLLLLGGALPVAIRMHAYSVQPHLAQDRDDVSISAQSKEEIGFSRVLLNMQGLDEESFFTDGETEALWL